IAVVLEARLRHDDTGARHKAQNGVCTQLGNDAFTAFVTTGSKSRLNFLELLNARRSCAIRRQWWPGPPCHRVG
ncbi:MAG: hypothetical protein WAN86_00005, partial [Hyphomicrobiaceae bacterium]